jgi:hypothetical protein
MKPTTVMLTPKVCVRKSGHTEKTISAPMSCSSDAHPNERMERAADDERRASADT